MIDPSGRKFNYDTPIGRVVFLGLLIVTTSTIMLLPTILHSFDQLGHQCSLLDRYLIFRIFSDCRPLQIMDIKLLERKISRDILAERDGSRDLFEFDLHLGRSAILRASSVDVPKVPWALPIDVRRSSASPAPSINFLRLCRRSLTLKERRHSRKT